jgi:ribosome-binding factor A
MSQRRLFRVAERIQTLVASTLPQAADPRFGLVTITSVMVSPDLRQAKVYWVIAGDGSKRQAAEQAFIRAASFFRRIVAKELGLRHAPQLRFYYDDLLDTCAEVDRLLQQVETPTSNDD